MPDHIHRIEFTTVRPVPRWPVVEVIAWERSAKNYWHWTDWRRDRSGILQITLSGCGMCRWNGQPRWQEVPPGRAMLFTTGGTPEGFEYRVADHAQDWEFLWLGLRGEGGIELVQGLIEQAGRVQPFPGDHPQVRRWMGQLPRDYAAHRVIGGSESAMIVEGFLHVLANSPELAGGSAPDQQLVARALAAMDANWAAPQSIGQLATQLGVSREHLVRRFHVVIGQTPSDWQRHHRVHRVADRLINTDRSVAELARDSGFATSSHLIKVFRKVLGETPDAYRRRRHQNRPVGD